MSGEMTFEQTKELEENIKIKDRAIKICEDFKNNIVLLARNYKGESAFTIWSDSHNEKYVIAHEKNFEFICAFLHENYAVMITPEAIFNSIKSGSPVIGHLEVIVRGN